MEVKSTKVRKLVPESWGFVCPVHTPDGLSCGVLNHLAKRTELVASELTVMRGGGVISCAEAIRAALPRLGVLPVYVPGATRVIVDGRVVGCCANSCVDRVVAGLRALRRRKEIHPFAEIVLKDGWVLVFTTQERMMRPILVDGEEEFIGTLEQTTLVIGLAEQTDAGSAPGGAMKAQLREIDGPCSLSLVASLIPFSNYNQSPRNMYQCQMAKQTMGHPTNIEFARTDSKSYHIHDQQIPIVRTRNELKLAAPEFPLGMNAVVAVLSYTAFDMEDALMISRAAIERGLFRGCIYKTISICTKDYGGLRARFAAPTDDSPCGADGLVSVGCLVSTGTTLACVQAADGHRTSVRWKDKESGYVESVIRYTGGARIKVRVTRTPAVGDKFSSRHGQKGVVSMPWSEVDIPFCESGIRPDIIINPHAFPSRMTIGMLLESLCGKARSASAVGPFDATSFETYDEKNRLVDVVGAELLERGFNRYGSEVMYSGISGEMCEADVYIGVVYYQRLRHMVAEKVQVRATGKVNALTLQPPKGKRTGGGIRLGEMEKDALLGHGASFLLRDRHMWCSDGRMMPICRRCGCMLFVEAKPEENTDEPPINWCRLCADHRQGFDMAFIPWGCRILAAELAGMGILMRMRFASAAG